ncbi:MAG: hypothetical protein WAM52_04705 [Steroidobacteraceae bacterium]
MSVASEARPTVLFVFGMGRSGSSALTRVLSLCGGTLPGALVGATDGNPLGHWEPENALALNQDFLSQHGATWFDPTLRLQGEVAFAAEQRSAYLHQIRAFLAPLATAPIILVKEPRITALSDFWFEAARQLGLSIAVVIPVRHPEEVAASLAARDQTSSELSCALWLKYNLLGERESRPYPRVFVEYTNLLSDWRVEVSRIAAALSLDLSVRDEATVEQFLRPDLHRQRLRGRISEPFGNTWISRLYGVLSGAARDEPLDTALLDEVFASYRASERAFRVALDDFRARFASVDVGRNPNITALISAVAGANSQALRACLRSDWYGEHNADVLAAGCDPYEHWVAYGVNEGRLPCEDPLALLERLMRERASAEPAPKA